ncbi:MAG: hypothetical protein AAGD96_35105, partial [Chloroflexota bacterium]
MDNYVSPVPVLLMLSKWDPTEKNSSEDSIEKWILQELASPQYRMSVEESHLLLDQRQIILVFDELDQLSEKGMESCVDALNLFLSKHPDIQLVISSRLDAYQNIDNQLDLRRAIVIEPLTKTQLDNFFDKAGDQLAGLNDLRRSSEEIEKLLALPMMLNFFSLAFRHYAQSKSVGRLDSISNPESLKNRLIDVFVENQLNISESKSSFKKARLKHWLGWLSQSLVKHRQSVFHIENIQASWLPSRTLTRRYVLMSRWLLILFGGVFAGLLYGSALLLGGQENGLARGLSEGPGGALVAGGLIAYIDWMWISTWAKQSRVKNMPVRRRSAVKIASFILASVIGVLVVFVGIFAPLGWIVDSYAFWLADGVLVGITFGLASGLLFGFGEQNLKSNFRREINVPQRLTWSFKRGRRWGLLGLIIGVVMGTFSQVWGGSVYSQMYQMAFDTYAQQLVAQIVAAAVVLGLVGVLFGGLYGVIAPDQKLTPNYALTQTLVNVAIIAPCIGLGFGLIALIIGWLLIDPAIGAFSIWFLVPYGLFIGLLGMAGFGGRFLTKHFVLRFMLWRHDLTPPVGRMVEFLNDSTQSLLMQRV